MTREIPPNIVWHPEAVNRADRENLNGHRAFTLWLTGMPASGKSTIANAVEKALHEMGCHTYVLDGDRIRHGLNRDLGFSPQDRQENIRRIAELSALLRDAGIINLVAFISPYRVDRQKARELCQNDGTFIEVFVDCPSNICEQRDPKGLYRKARAGILTDFTGVSAPYEAPLNPEIHLRSDTFSTDECVCVILEYLRERGLIPCYLPMTRNTPAGAGT